MQEILMNTHKFWREIQQTKWHFWEERRVLPFVLHYYVQLYCEGDSCAKMVGKEETPKCRKKTVTWTNEMIEDLIDFIEIHPIVAFEAIYEPMLTSFWRLLLFTFTN
jgi:hypothetical protein